MSRYHDRGRDDRNRDDRSRDDRSRDDRSRDDRYGGRGNRDQNRQRSRSPGSTPRGYSRGRGELQRSAPRRGQQGNWEDYETSSSPTSSLPALPTSAPFPEGTGATIPYTGRVVRSTLGRKVKVFTNHFIIETLPIIKIYEYDFRFTVPESSQARGSEKVTASQMARILVHSSLLNLLGEHFIFDGVSLGWSPKELMPIGQSRSTTISLGKRRDNKPNEIEIAIRNSGTLNIGAFVQYLQNSQTVLNPMGDPTLEPVLKWLNAVFRSDLEKNMISRPMSNAFFQRSRETSAILHSTGGVLEAARGIFQTVQIRFCRLTLNVDAATTPFWVPDRSLIHCVCALTGERSAQNLQNSFTANPNSFFRACDMLLGSYFNVKHLNEIKNAKKMKFLSWSKQDAMSTTFDEQIEDGERYRGQLQGSDTADFIKFATTPAFVRRQQINTNLRTLAWHNKPDLLAHGLSVNPAMMLVDAVVLPTPQPVYSHEQSARVEEGQWNLLGLKFLKPSNIKSWLFVCFVGQVNVLDSLGRDLIQSFRNVGMSVPSRPPTVVFGNLGDVEGTFRDSIATAERDFGSPPELILIILKDKSSSLYDAIKQSMDVRHGIASQVMLLDKVSRGGRQYLANISLKVNVKLRGVNSTVDEPLFRQSRWMLIGGDTSMASPSALRKDPPPPTTAGLCASWDRACASYTGVASIQQSKEANSIVHVKYMFKELLMRYQEKNNGLLPEHIIYYRDGASESEFDAIRDKEGLELRRICQECGADAKITLIIAVKRHHTRFFAQEDIATKLGNVPPGTVVENSSLNDAFIVGHRGLQGTCRPTHYITIVDENKLSPDAFHRLTYGLCSTYARATKSISVVPSIRYADQICERARSHLQDRPDGTQFLSQVHDRLKWNMYWQ